MCLSDNHQVSFLCPNGTIFAQVCHTEQIQNNFIVVCDDSFVLFLPRTSLYVTGGSMLTVNHLRASSLLLREHLEPENQVMMVSVQQQDLVRTARELLTHVGVLDNVILIVSTVDFAGRKSFMILNMKAYSHFINCSFDGCANTCVDGPAQSSNPSGNYPNVISTRRPSSTPSKPSRRPSTSFNTRPSTLPNTTPRQTPSTTNQNIPSLPVIFGSGTPLVAVTTPRVTPGTSRRTPGQAPPVTTYRPVFSTTSGYTYPEPDLGVQLVLRPDPDLPVLYGPPS